MLIVDNVKLVSPPKIEFIAAITTNRIQVPVLLKIIKDSDKLRNSVLRSRCLL